MSAASRPSSRFNATTAFLLPGARRLHLPDLGEFQCHHGVSASHRGAVPPASRAQGFNATTAFLLPSTSKALCRPPSGFNATTAFLLLRRGPPHAGGVSRFNATTAFLLPSIWPGRTTGLASFQCHHGVSASPLPPREAEPRSEVSMPPRRFCFENGWAKVKWEEQVSMPPRRFCFVGLAAVIAFCFLRFNATTAFLLPLPEPLKFGDLTGFNATTAFLLRASSAPHPSRKCEFQCHHGVSASGTWWPGRWAAPFRCEFQCHHGVSASRSPRTWSARRESKM